MPWTFAHPAAVLPLRKYCSVPYAFAALVCGSLSPDIGYYCNRFPMAIASHHFEGSIRYCMPLSIALLIVFILLHRSFFTLLPQPHRDVFLTNLKKYRFAWYHIFIWMVAALLGAWSHIAWDSFTHQSGWSVKQLPFLKQDIFHRKMTYFPIYQVLQYASTVFGCMLFFFMYLKKVRQQKLSVFRFYKADLWRWLFIITVCAVSFIHAWSPAVQRAKPFHGLYSFRVFSFCLAVDATNVFLLCVFTSCILLSGYSFVKNGFLKRCLNC